MSSSATDFAHRLSYRPHIDGLRAFAVTVVVLFHAFPAVMPAGFIGVDVFFVISGFLISGHLYEAFLEDTSPGWRVIARFYGRRIRRIFPALILVLFSVLAAGYWILLPNELQRLGRSTVATAGFCLNLLLASQTGYFDQNAAYHPLIHLWSLGVEEQFYLVWPLLLWGLFRARIKVGPAILFLTTCSFTWALLKVPNMQMPGFYTPQTRMWELLIGAFAAYLHPKIPSFESGRGATVANVLSMLGLGLLVAGFIVIKGGTNFPNATALLPTLGAACLVCSHGQAWLNRHLFSRKLLVGIGLISYPLYLWHWPLLIFTKLGLLHGDTAACRLGAVAFAVLLAILTYRFIETPIRRGAFAGRKIAGLVAGLLAAVAVAGYYYRQEGFPNRYPPLVRAFANFAYPFDVEWRTGTYFLSDPYVVPGFKEDQNEVDPRKPSIVIWGDSHAAGLTRGFDARFGSAFNIVQRTIRSHLPFLPIGGEELPENKYDRQILETIRLIRPKYVVLHGNFPNAGWRPILETIQQIQNVSDAKVIVVGPVPQWYGGLPLQLCNYYRTHKTEPLPYHMNFGERPEPAEVEAELRPAVEATGATYLSALQLLHKPDGMVVRTGDAPDSILSFDDAHLTTAGAIYLVAQFPAL